jgi:hypothetical protein
MAIQQMTIVSPLAYFVFLEVRTVFLLFYFVFVVLSLYRMTRSRVFRAHSARSRIGVLGLLAGSSSAILLAWFYTYIWTLHKLPAHGSALWTLTVVGEALAILGVILGFLGTGWIRQSGLLISAVPVFQWGRTSAGRGPISLVDLAMFASVVLIGLVSLANHCVQSRRASS